MENKPKASIENLLTTIEDILDGFENRKEPIQLTPELLIDIDKVENFVKVFQENTQEIFSSLNIDITDPKKMIPSQSQSNIKQTLNRLKNLKVQAYAIKLAISKTNDKITKYQKGKGLPQNSQVDKQQIKERRKLFKSIGGDKQWLPL